MHKKAELRSCSNLFLIYRLYRENLKKRKCKKSEQTKRNKRKRRNLMKILSSIRKNSLNQTSKWTNLWPMGKPTLYLNLSNRKTVPTEKNWWSTINRNPQPKTLLHKFNFSWKNMHANDKLRDNKKWKWWIRVNNIEFSFNI